MYSPLILVDKSVRGCGGSLLVDTIGVILKGEPLARVPQAQNDEEQRKVITSVLLAGDDLVLVDNLSHPLGGASIDALLTGSVWRDRLLGRNELSLVPNLATFYATGYDLLDGKSIVRPRESLEWTRALASIGVFAGISSGAIAAGAAKCAAEIESGVIVMIVCDSGWKYLSTGAWTADLDDVEARAKGIIYF